MTIGASIDYPKSENQTISHAVIVGLLYSTFVFDTAAIGCYLLLQLIAPLPKET